MTATEVLMETLRLGVTLRPQGEFIAASPAEKLLPETRERIRAEKPALVRLLADPAALRVAARDLWAETVERISMAWLEKAREAAARGLEARWLNEAQDGALQEAVGTALRGVRDPESLREAREAMARWESAWRRLLAP